MAADDAILLDNWFPEQSRIRVRRGSADHMTGFSAAVESLMTWAGPTSQKMFAAAGTAIYEATGAGAVGAAVVSGLANARWQHVNFGTGGGQYLYMVNGADNPRHYDGTSWVSPTLTGVTKTTLISVNIFKRRLFFIPVSSMSFWFLAVNSISGALSEFDLAPLFSKGGYLMAMGTWTVDGGDGEDDHAAFITSEGEIAVYEGLDPGDASLWRLVGVFAIGAPIGRRCMIKLGGDLIVITEDGYAPMARVISGGRQKTDTLSDKISGAVSNAVRAHRANWGWQAIHYPAGSMAIVNVPVVAGAAYHQHVINTETGKWCRFKNLNAHCWAILNHEIYFGGLGVGALNAVVKADTGLSDNDGVIQADARTAYQYFGSPGLNKTFMARPVLVADGTVNVAIALSVDYVAKPPTSTATFSTTGAVWDVATWDVDAWDTEVTNLIWKDLNGNGKAASLWIRTNSSAGAIRWPTTDWVYTTAPAGLL